MATDLVTEAVKRIRAALIDAPDQTVADLSSTCHLTENIVRRALDVLVYTGEVEAGFPSTVGRKGLPPRVFSLAKR